MSTYLEAVFPTVLESVLFKEKIAQSMPMFNWLVFSIQLLDLKANQYALP